MRFLYHAQRRMVFDNKSSVCSFPLILLQIELLLSVAPRRARDPWWHGRAWTLIASCCAYVLHVNQLPHIDMAYHESIWNRYGISICIDHRQHSASACGPAHGPHRANIETSTRVSKTRSND